ncbi:helix-turn-helix transcriptional regulator [Streptomyces brevispora]|uniref:helix-turn-helix domain-containing protein n=1 Tax=Streptomyces brevispora TaxID=887462 RepID=UPI00340C65B4
MPRGHGFATRAPETGKAAAARPACAPPGSGFLRCIGRQTKPLREAAGLTQTELGAIVGYGEAQVAAAEQGRRIPKPEMVDAVDLAVGGRGVLLRHRSRSDTTSDRPRKRQDPARSIRSDGIL